MPAVRCTSSGTWAVDVTVDATDDDLALVQGQDIEAVKQAMKDELLGALSDYEGIAITVDSFVIEVVS